ncbi:unnamed protein product [Urochloa humidicola]
MDAGANLLTNCSAAALKRCSHKMHCPANETTTTFLKSMRSYAWKHDALIVTDAVLAGVIVGIGAYGQRYRHHPFTRFIFLGATTLFLPIISSVVSSIGTDANYVFLNQLSNFDDLSALVAICGGTSYSLAFVTWAFLVQIIVINTSTIVSVEDREGQSKAPPFELLVQGIWALYLGLSNYFKSEKIIARSKGTIQSRDHELIQWGLTCLHTIIPFSLLCSKIVLKSYAFEKARRSFALGRNPGLVSFHIKMLQAQEANQNFGTLIGQETPPPPPLLVMREEEKQVEMQPSGYAFKDDDYGTTLINNVGLVTLDRVWQLDSMLPISTPHLKDLCLSFALFKLLRCRFARYKLTGAGSMGTVTFFRSFLLKVGEHDRVFGVVADELSFVHDYYYSSLPVFYSKCCLPKLSIFLSFLTLSYCLLFPMILIALLIMGNAHHVSQVNCSLWCIEQPFVAFSTTNSTGAALFDLVPLLLLFLFVVIAEARDMASYICSNWTKVALICRYVNRASSQHSFCMPKWVSLVLHCRWKLMNHWDGKMSQCSVLTLQPSTSPLVLVRHLLHLPDQRRKVKVPAAVKACIISAVRSSFNGGLSNGVQSLRQSQVSESFIWACHGKGTSDTILVWHIATYILEVKHRYRHDHEQGSPPISNSDHKIAATHLSQHCAYLVNWCPELLPDNKAWSKSLYEAVKKDAECALAEHPAPGSSAPEDEYEKLVELLQANSKHVVLKNGVKLGMQLVEKIDDEEAIWKLLAEFWSEMILFVAPSENLKAHSEAIARGGELITLLWALLFHAGIVSRPGEDDSATATSGDVV